MLLPFLYLFFFYLFSYSYGIYNPSSQQVLAQQDESQEGDENFDPFSDYSELNESTEEEADIHFFRNGRLLNLSLNMGQRFFTQNLKYLYSKGPTYGLGITYFFDLRFAGYFSFLTSDHRFRFVTDNGTTTGNVGMTFLSFDLKYYLNTDVLIKPLAALNPYWLLGLNQTYRNLSISTEGEVARDSSVGLEVGAGIELFVLRNQSFIGIQGAYRYFNFVDESQQLIDPVNMLPTKVRPSGDSYDILLLLGTHF
jgi:hypothetical protein